MFISVETERRRREEEGGGLRQGEVLITSPRTAQIFAAELRFQPGKVAPNITL